MRACLLLLALALFAPAGAAESGWKLKQNDIRETCVTATDKTELCLFKQSGIVWISVLVQSEADFSNESMLAQIDGTPYPVYRHSSDTRPALVSLKSGDTKVQPSMSSFRLRPNDTAFQDALKTGRVLTVSTAPFVGPVWQVQVSLDGLAATLAQL
ncbi:hypothetical protein [Niveispirillum sp.]|uniref:hypothetical protein n=1 Tax=Niveispirillum sp. TaxID=1917217 RepID=UPI0025E95BA7|nr:hypothetical protein [Niveispirillum sp.]